MIIVRTRLFSKDSKDEDKKLTKGKAVAIGLAGGGTAGNFIHRKLVKIGKTKYKEEGERLNKKLLEEAEGKGVKILDELPNKKKKETPKWLNKLIKETKSPAYSPDMDTVITQGSKDAAILSHELGHRHYLKENSGKIGKGAHKAYMALLGEKEHTLLSPAAAHFAGKAAGKNKARREERGEKESKLGKIAPIATPVLVAAPGLAAEALASRKGIKILKSHGASKEFIRESKHKLGNAFGSYTSLAAVNAGMGELSKDRAYKKEKKKIEQEKKKEEERKKEI